MTGQALQHILYRILGTIAHVVLLAALPIVKHLAPEWEIERRLGRYSLDRRPAHVPLIWLHVASVGEVQAALVLIAVLSSKISSCRFLLTTMTRQGREAAQAKVPGNVRCELAPLDTHLAVMKAIQTVQPDIYICLETELWPMMLTEVKRAGIPMLLLNGRMSERSLRTYLWIKGFIAEILNGFTGVAAITEQDGERYRRLGVAPERIQICGNMKYNVQVAEAEQVREQYRQVLNLTCEPVFICGSTRSGEEELLLPVYRRLRRESVAGLVWIIAPRHLNRLAEVGRVLEKAGLAYDLFSQCTAKHRTKNIVLVDSIGELADLYSIGEYNFCGGSLVAKGGHNIMEPISRGKPVYFGPFMADFQDAVGLILSAGAGFQVSNAEELADCLAEQMRDARLYRQARKAAVGLASVQRDSALRQAEMVVQQIAASISIARQDNASSTALLNPLI